MDSSLETIGLRCPNYSQLLMEGVWSQYINKSRTDLVITINDFRIKAHQMMIAIFAPKLLDIFDGSRCDLSDISIDEHILSNVFEFIYRGEVTVVKNNLENLRKFAEEMNVTFLIDSIDRHSNVPLNAIAMESEDPSLSEKNREQKRPRRRRTNVSYTARPRTRNKTVSVHCQAEEITLEEESSNDDENNSCDDDEKPEEGALFKRTRGPLKERLVVKCPHCDFESTSQRRLLRHLSKEHDVNIKKRLKIRFKCIDCDFLCDLRNQLSTHRKMEHSRNRLRKCPECDFSSTLKRVLDRHIQNAHSTDRPFSCALCDYKAKCQADLYAHRSTHRTEKFKCHVCSSFITSKKNFNRHMKIHENPEVHKQPHRCHLCSFRSWTKTLLSKHLRKVHNCDPPTISRTKPKITEKLKIPEVGLQCQMCDYKTKEHQRWIDHLAVKHQVDVDGNKLEPNISCEHCDYTCYVQSQIRRHMILAHSNKRFQCGYCEYVSYNKTQVSYHVKAKHFSEKPFMCETCGMRFVTECLLRRHVLTHGGGDNYTCDICKKSFALQSYLRKHVRHMHDTFAKKHMCHMCAFITKTKDALKQHMKRMHKEIVSNEVQQSIATPAIIVEEIPM